MSEKKYNPRRHRPTKKEIEAFLDFYGLNDNFMYDETIPRRKENATIRRPKITVTQIEIEF